MKRNNKQWLTVAALLAAISANGVQVAHTQQTGNTDMDGSYRSGRGTTMGYGMSGNYGTTWRDTRNRWSNQLPGLNDNDWRLLHNRFYGLSDDDRRAWFTTMSRMSPTERGVFLRGLNNSGPYGIYRYSYSPGDFTYWSQGVISGISPADRPAFTTWIGRLSEPDRVVFQRVWDANNRNAPVWYGLSNDDQISLNQALGNLSSADMVVAMNMLQRMTPAEKEVLVRMASGDGIRQGSWTPSVNPR